MFAMGVWLLALALIMTRVLTFHLCGFKWIRVSQPINSLLIGCLNPCLQGTSVQVVSP